LHDVSLTINDKIHQAFSETTDYQKVPVTANKKNTNQETQPTPISIRRNENQLESNSKIKRKDRFQNYQDNKPQDGRSNDSITTKPVRDLTLIKIKSLIDEKRRAKSRGRNRYDF
jgi:hypothetical protein